MAASLGSLIVSIAGDIAQLEVSMSRAEYIVSQFADKAETAMARVEQAVVGAAAAYVSFEALSGLADQLQGAIEATAALEKLSLQAGTTAENLSGLRDVAAESGTSMEQVVTSLDRLSKSMVDAGNGTGKAASAFIALGLNVHDASGNIKDSSEFMQEVADKLSSLGNTTEEVAYTMAIFGRGGAALLPMLHDLADAHGVVASQTEQAAGEAERYQRTLNLLGIAAQDVWRTIGTQVTPVLAAVAQTMLDLANGVDGTRNKVKDLAADNTIQNWAISLAMGIAGAADTFRFLVNQAEIAWEEIKLGGVIIDETMQNIGAAIAFARDMLVQFATASIGIALIATQNYAEGWMLVKSATESAGAGIQTIAARVDESKTTVTAALAATDKAVQGLKDGFDFTKITDLFTTNLLHINDGLKASSAAHTAHAEVLRSTTLDAYDQLIAKLDVTAAKLQYQIAYYNTYGEVTKETTLATVAQELAEGKLTDAIMKKAGGDAVQYGYYVMLALAQANWVDGLKAEMDTDTQLAQVNAEWLKQANDQIEKLNEQAATYDQTASAVTRYKIAQLQAIADMLEAFAPVDPAIKVITDEITRLQQVASSQDAYQGVKNFSDAVVDAANKVGQIAGAFTGGVKNGIEAAHAALKSFIADLVEMLAKQFVLNIAANVTGSSSLAGAAAQVGAGSSTSLFGSAISTGANYLSGGTSGLAGIFGNAGSFGVEGGLTTGSGLAGAATSLASLAGASDTLALSIGEMVPVIGWVVAIGAVLYSVFGSKGGGPKSGGSAFSQFDSDTGALVSGMNVPGTDNGRFYTPNEGDTGLATATASIGTSFAQALKALGGTSGNLNFGLGYDTDPNGTASSRVSSMVTNSAGGVIYQNINQDTKDIQGTLTLESQRMLLAALQQSSLPKAVADILNTVVASTATADQITAALQAATEATAVMAGLKQLNITGLDIDSLKQMQQSGETLTQTFQRVGTEWINFNDAFETDAQKLADAQSVVTSTFNTLGIAVPESASAFYDLVHSLDLSTDAGRTTFNALMQVAPAFQTVTNAAAAAVQQFNSIASGLSSSFGASNNQSILDAAVQHWMSLTAANSTGWTVASTIQNIGNLINTGQIGSALTYAQSLEASGISGAVSALNSMLSAYATVNSSSNSNSSSAGNFSAPSQATSNLTDLANAASQAAQALWQAKDSVASWMSKTLLSSSLSPLSGAQQLSFAQDQYTENLMAAQAGNVTAIGNFSDYADQYLQAARSYYASSGDYNTIFAAVMQQAGGVAGLQDATRPVTAGDAQSNAQAIVDAINALATQVGISTKNTDLKTLMTMLRQSISDGTLTLSS